MTTNPFKQPSGLVAQLDEVQPKCRLASQTIPRTLGKSERFSRLVLPQDKASVSDFAKSCIPSISPSPPPKKKLPIATSGWHLFNGKVHLPVKLDIMGYMSSSFVVGSSSGRYISQQLPSAPSVKLFKNKWKRRSSKGSSLIFVRVQRIQRWDLSMDQEFCKFQNA